MGRMGWAERGEGEWVGWALPRRHEKMVKAQQRQSPAWGGLGVVLSRGRSADCPGETCGSVAARLSRRRSAMGQHYHGIRLTQVAMDSTQIGHESRRPVAPLPCRGADSLIRWLAHGDVLWTLSALCGYGRARLRGPSLDGPQCFPRQNLRNPGAVWAVAERWCKWLDSDTAWLS